MTIAQKRAFLTNILFVSVLFVILYLAYRYLLVWILPFVLGFLIAYLLRKPAVFLSRVTKIPQKGTAVILLLLFYLTIGVLLWFSGMKLLLFLGDFFRNLPDFYKNNIEPAIGTLLDACKGFCTQLSPEKTGGVEAFFSGMMTGASDFVAQFSAKAFSSLTGLAAGVPNVVMTCVFTVLSSVFISLDYGMIVSFLTRQIPGRYRLWLFDIKDFLNSVVFQLMKAYTIIMLVTFAELSIGFFVLRIDNFIFAAAAVALFDMLPVLGAGAVMVPWILYLLLQNQVTLAIGLGVVYAIIITVRGILEPKIVSSQVGLHPLITLTAMFFGLKTLGFGGMLLMPVFILVLKYMHETGKVKFWKEKPPVSKKA